MKRSRLIGSIVLLIGLMYLLIVAPSDGKEFFMYDAENNQIMEMASTENTFSEKLSLDKLPDRMMSTDTPDNFIALYLPEMEKRKPTLIESLFSIPVIESKALNTGRIILWNTKTERTTDLVDLGYPPYSWVYTKDHKHLFVSYRPSQSEETTELLHYSASDKKSEKVLLPVHNVNYLALSYDESQLYILGDDKPRQPQKGSPILSNPLFKGKKPINLGQEFNAQMITMSYAPLEVKATLPTENIPVKIMNISKERSVIISQDWAVYTSGYMLRGFGSIKLINTLENKVVQENQLLPTEVYTQWFEDQKTLIVACNSYSMAVSRVNSKESVLIRGKGMFYKVTENDIQASKVTSEWVNFEYYPEQDQLHMISQRTLETINFSDGSYKKVKIKLLEISKRQPLFENHLYRIPGSNLGIIYSYNDTLIQVFDFNKGKVVDDMKTGRGLSRFLGNWFHKAPKTIVNTNEDQSSIYFFSASSGDITILNQKLKRTGFIVPSDELLDVYQIKKPAWNTLVATTKGLYQLDYAKNALTAIYEFKDKIEDISFIEDNNRLLVIADRDFLVLDTAALSITQHISLFGDPDQTYTKLKKGDQRYYFVNNL